MELIDLTQDFDNFRGKEYLDLICAGCKMTFSRNKNEHKQHIKQGHRNIYCSNSCQIKFTKKTQIEINCKFCNKKVLKKKSVVDKNWPNLFCNSSCFARWNNKNRKINSTQL